MTGVTLTDSLMSKELFAPILPVITTSSLSAVCSLVNEISADPLGLYIMSNKQLEIEYVLQNTFWWYGY